MNKYVKIFLIFYLVSTLAPCILRAQSESEIQKRKRIIDKIEVFAGPNLSLNYGNKFIENHNDKNTHNKRLVKVGYSFGLGMYHPISSKLSLNLKFSFEEKGSKSEFDNGSLLIESRYKYHYLSFFVAPRIILHKNVFGSIGGYYSLIKNVQGYEVVHSDQDVYKERFEGRNIRVLRGDGSVQSITFIRGLQSFESFDYGLSIRLGYLLSIRGNHNISFELSDNFGLKNINKLSDGNLPEYNHSVNFAVGYALNRAKK